MANAARGRYLVATSGCMDCHTPMKMGANGPEWDMSRMLSGHPDSLQMPPVPVLPEGPWLVISSAPAIGTLKTPRIVICARGVITTAASSARLAQRTAVRSIFI